MTDQDTHVTNRFLVDLSALAGSCPAAGPGWTHQSDDLNVNLLVFAAGDGVAEHRNDDVDVLVVGIHGRGSIEVDGRAHDCQPGQAMVIPKGSRRATRAVSERFAYLTCHRRRAGLWPSVRTSSAP